MSPRPDVSEERRAQIAAAALSCFTRKGYNNTTMDDIVAESGLSKGSLYWYYSSKEDLFSAALLSVFENGFGEATATALAQCETASERLLALGEMAAAMARVLEGYFGLFLEFWASSPRREETGQFWFDLLQQYKGIVVAVVEGGIRNGEFKPVDAEELVWAMMAAYDGLGAYMMLMPDLDLDRINQVLVETLLNGLKAE